MHYYFIFSNTHNFYLNDTLEENILNMIDIEIE